MDSRRASVVGAWLAIGLSAVGLLSAVWRLDEARARADEREALARRVSDLEAAERRFAAQSRPSWLPSPPPSFHPSTRADASSSPSLPAPGEVPARTTASPGATAQATSPTPPLWAPAAPASKAEEIYRSSFSLDPPKDREALEEAIRLEPNNPKYRAALITNLWPDATARTRLQAELEQLNSIDRDNALAPYFLAHLANEAGDVAAARRWAEDALSRPALRMYSIDEAEARLANLLTAKPDAPSEAMMGVLFSTMLPALVPIRNSARLMTEASAEALAAGNFDEARRLAEAPQALLHQMAGRPSFHIDQLVALSVEGKSLDASRRVAEAQGDTARMQEIDRAQARIAIERDLYRRIAVHSDYVFTSGGISSADIRDYARRTIEQGEAAAALGMRPSPGVRK